MQHDVCDFKEKDLWRICTLCLCMESHVVGQKVLKDLRGIKRLLITKLVEHFFKCEFLIFFSY